MIFLNPEFLYLMLPPLLVLGYFVLTRGSVFDKYFSKEVLDKLLIKGDKLGSKGRNVLFLVAFTFFIFALSRPQTNLTEQKIQSVQSNLVIALDISRSMLVKDVYPNRLDFAKNRLKWLIENLQNTNIGVVAFAKDAFLVSPITSDKKSLEFLLQELSPEIVSRQGTSITNALKQINQLFGKENSKDVLIISDGGEKKDIKEAINEAKKDNLNVSVMIIGTEKGGVIETKEGLLKDKNGNIVISKRNDFMMDLSKATNGTYIKEYGTGGGIRLFEKSLSKKQDKDNEEKTIKTSKEWFMIPLSLGFLCVFIALHGLMRKKIFLLLPFLFITPSHSGVLDFYHIKKADDFIKEKKYENAIKEYDKLKPTPQIHLNKGNAYYKMGKFDKALSEYKAVKTKDGNLKAKALYNEGNSYAKNKKYEEALKTYEEALKLTPKDEDLKANIEYVKKKLKEKKQKNKNNKKQDKKNKKDKNNKQQNKNNKQNKNEQNKNEQNKDNDKKQDKKDDKNKQNKEKKSEEKKENKTASKSQNMKDLKDKEGQKLEEMLQKLHPKTHPMRLGKQKNYKGDENEITW